MKKFNCNTCSKKITDRNEAMVYWSKYDKKNNPVWPLITHKDFVQDNKGLRRCSKIAWDHCYEITDFIKDFRGIKLEDEIR